VGADSTENTREGQRPGDNLKGLRMFSLGNQGHISVSIYMVRTGMGARRRISFVYGIGSGYGLCIRLINRFPFYEALIVEIGETDRANFGAISAPCTFVKIDISCTSVQGDLKIAGFAGNFFNLGYGVKLYINVPADLDQFGRDNSHGTVIGGECLVQL